MNKGFVIFVIVRGLYEPRYLKFDSAKTIRVADIEDATVYPIYEAAEAVVNAIKDEYICIKILDTDGNPCFDGERSNERVSRDTRYVRKSSSKDDFF